MFVESPRSPANGLLPEAVGIERKEWPVGEIEVLHLPRPGSKQAFVDVLRCRGYDFYVETKSARLTIRGEIAHCRPQQPLGSMEVAPREVDERGGNLDKALVEVANRALLLLPDLFEVFMAFEKETTVEVVAPPLQVPWNGDHLADQLFLATGWSLHTSSLTRGGVRAHNPRFGQNLAKRVLTRSTLMADAHGHEDPNAAPMHHDIVERFTAGPVVFCYLLALVALVAGIVAGLTLVE